MTKQLMNPKELLKKQLAEANERVAASESTRIKLGPAGFTVPGGDIGSELDVAIIDYTMVHAFYPGAYDPDNIVNPTCYANARLVSELIPIEKSPDIQGDSCMVCPQNRFGSAPNGKAKACKNSRLLALVPHNNIGEAPVWSLSVSPTGLKNYDNYVKELADLSLTPMFVRTKVTFVAKGTFAIPSFTLIAPLESTEIADVMTRMEEARTLIDRHPDYDKEES